MKRTFNKITALMSAFAFTIPSIVMADTVAKPKSMVDEDTGEPTTKFVSKKNYDFVKDITSVKSLIIQFEKNQRELFGGIPISDAVGFRFSYEHEGKTPKRPDSLILTFMDTKIGESYTVKNIFLRFGNKKMILPISKQKNVDLTDVGTTEAAGKIAVDDFVELSKSKEIYIKVDDAPIIYLIEGEYTQPLVELAKTIPNTPKAPAAKTPPKAKPAAKSQPKKK